MADIRILQGTPDDDNREYLPEKIRNTDIVVNENGNNSIVYPKRLQEFKEAVIDGVEDVWYEYVPESYDPSKKVPLIIGLHGGLMTGWGHAVYTSWTLVADREGFIDVYKRQIQIVPGMKNCMFHYSGIFRGRTERSDNLLFSKRYNYISKIKDNMFVFHH